MEKVLIHVHVVAWSSFICDRDTYGGLSLYALLHAMSTIR